MSADKRIPVVRITQGCIEESTTEPALVSCPIAEDSSVQSVTQRLLSVWRSEMSEEVFGRATINATLAVLH